MIENGNPMVVSEVNSNITDRQRLESWFNSGCRRADTQLNFGRKMPFGKYKNTAVYVLLVRHPMYMNWILNNTTFNLDGDEKWLKDRVDLALDLSRVGNLILGLSSQMGLGGVDNIENPHWVVE